MCSVSKLVCYPHEIKNNGDNEKNSETKSNNNINNNDNGENGANEKKNGWVVEMDGSCTHLSKGEQFHWTFGL